VTDLASLPSDTARCGTAPTRGPGRVEAAAAGVVGAAAVAVLGYRLGAGEPAEGALGAALAVLIVAGPGALRLATRLPLLVVTGRAARHGVLLHDPGALTSARCVDTVVLAGTGTLTNGELEVRDVHVIDGHAPADVLRFAGAVAQESDRPIDRAVAAASPWLPGVAEFDRVDDLGVRGIVAEVVRAPGEGPRVIAHAVLVGSAGLLAAHDVGLPAELAAPTGHSGARVAVAWDGVARGVLEVGPAVAPASAAAVSALGGLGLRPVLLASEAAPVAQAVAARAGIARDAVVAGVAPEDAASVVRGLRDSGSSVAVIAGSGRHEAALGTADLAVRIGPTGDHGAAAALACSDLPAAVEAIRLARRTVAVTRTNVVLALGCVAAVLPAAATGLLGPLLSTAATATGAVVLVVNSLRLQRYRTTGG
jgi:cation transport ATPase